MTDERYDRARKRVEELRGFYWHFMVFVFVNAMLLGIDVLSGDGYWFYWPLFGWGIGVAVHALSVFAGGPFGKQWEDRKIRQLMERDEPSRHTVEGDGPVA